MNLDKHVDVGKAGGSLFLSQSVLQERRVESCENSIISIPFFKFNQKKV
jgi:hypothetical protein